MDKNTEFHTYKPKQERSFRAVLKNIHPSTDLNGIKQSLTDKSTSCNEHMECETTSNKQTNKQTPTYAL
jgi:hypothetical protein